MAIQSEREREARKPRRDAAEKVADGAKNAPSGPEKADEAVRPRTTR